MAARVIRLPNVERLPVVLNTGKVAIASNPVRWDAPLLPAVVPLRQRQHERDDLILSRMAWCFSGFMLGVTLTVLAVAYAGGWK